MDQICIKLVPKKDTSEDEISFWCVSIKPLSCYSLSFCKFPMLILLFSVDVGCNMECQYKLMSFGVPHELLLTDIEGNLRQHYVDFWIQRQRHLEQERLQDEQQRQQVVVTDAVATPPASATGNHIHNATVQGEIVATEKDVLLGRGISKNRHPGNVRLNKLIKDHFDEYNASSMFDKTMLSWKIVRVIQGEGGRFLGRGTNGLDFGQWKIISDDSARHKVAYGFRSHTKLLKKREQKHRH